jgi:hypothetical protein
MLNGVDGAHRLRTLELRRGRAARLSRARRCLIGISEITHHALRHVASYALDSVGLGKPLHTCPCSEQVGSCRSRDSCAHVAQPCSPPADGGCGGAIAMVPTVMLHVFGHVYFAILVRMRPVALQCPSF